MSQRSIREAYGYSIDEEKRFLLAQYTGKRNFKQTMECVKAFAYKQSESRQIESGKFMESTTAMGGTLNSEHIIHTQARGTRSLWFAVGRDESENSHLLKSI